MSLVNREMRRNNNVVNSIISSNEQTEDEKFKPKSYYISRMLHKAVGLKATLDGVDKSEIVRNALTEYLKDILEEYKEVLR
jgi:hypothetical protein